MATIFNTGDTGSSSVWVAALQSLIDSGQTLLNSTEDFRINQLVEFNNKLTAINARRSRSLKIKGANIAALFNIVDFTTIDQTQTNATVRVDATTATLKERSNPSDLVAQQVNFTSSSGDVETLDVTDNQYRVNSSTSPVGTFDIVLNASFNVSVIVFDILSQASTPTIVVSLSNDGIIYTPAYSSSVSGYRVTAWFNSIPANRMRVAITPAMPDALGGTEYSFGFSDLASRSTAFNLKSTLVSLPVSFNPVSAQVALITDSDPNLLFYLLLSTDTNPGTFVLVNPLQPVATPGVTLVNNNEVHPTITTGLLPSLNTNYVLSTVQVVETTGGISKPMTVVSNLSYSDPYTTLSNEYIGLNSGSMVLVNGSKTINTARTFNISYLTAVPVTATLKVIFSTSSQATTPFFRGATLEEI